MKLIGDGRRLLNNTYVGNFVDAVFLAIDNDEALGETDRQEGSPVAHRSEDQVLDAQPRFLHRKSQASLGISAPGRLPGWHQGGSGLRHGRQGPWELTGLAMRVAELTARILRVPLK